MSPIYTGLDVGSNQFHLFGLDEHGQQMADQQINHGTTREQTEERLSCAVEALPGVVIVHMECCDMAGWLHDVLEPVTDQIIVSNPLTNSWISKDPDKQDRLDAEKLAELLRMDNYREVFLSGAKDRREFKRIVAHRGRLRKKEVRLLNQIKAHLRQDGIIVRAKTNWPEDKRHAVLEKLTPKMRTVLSQMFDLLDHTRDLRKQAEKLMIAAARDYPEFDRLKQAPGVGDVLACRFMAPIMNPHRFPNKRKLIRYCSLAVVHQTSDGKPLGYQRLNQDGVTELKTVSNFIFRCSLRGTTDHGFRRFYRKSKKRSQSTTKARLNTQRKIVVVLWTIWKKEVAYKDELVC